MQTRIALWSTLVLGIVVVASMSACPPAAPTGGGEGEGEGAQAGGEGEGVAGGEGEGVGGEGEGVGGEGEGVGGEGEGAGGEGEGEGTQALGQECDQPNVAGGCAAGLFCGFDTTGGVLDEKCENPPAGLSVGTSCDPSNPTACSTHLCLGTGNGSGLCSGPCLTDGDCNSQVQQCGAASVTVDGAGGVAHVCTEKANVTPTPCHHDGDCAGGLLCDDIVQPGGAGTDLSLECNVAGSGGALGAACTSPNLSDPTTCATGLCDGTTAGICTVACTSNADCTATSGFFCTGSGFSNVPDRFCAQTCHNDTPCGAGRSCQLRPDAVTDLQEDACDQNIGTSGPGTDIQSGQQNQCTTGLAVNFTASGTTTTVCTAICGTAGANSADCPFTDASAGHTALTTCGPVNGFTTPTGAPQSVNLCVKP